MVWGGNSGKGIDAKAIGTAIANVLSTVLPGGGNHQQGNHQKGWGKGGGKGKGPAASPEPSGRKWYCPCDKCKTLNGGRSVLNLPHLTACRVCYLPRAAVSARKQADKDTKIQELRTANAQPTPAEASAPLSKRAKKRVATEAKKAANQAPQKPAVGGGLAPDGAVPSPAPKTDGVAAVLVPVPGGTPPKAEPEPQAPPVVIPAKEPWVARPLEPSTVDTMNSFQEAWHEIISSISGDLYPPEVKPKTAEEVVTELLAGQKKVSSDSKYEEHVAAVAKLKTMIGMATEGSTIDKTLKDMLEAEETAREKAKKFVPSTEVLTSALKIAAEHWRMTVKERSERAEVGSTKSGERKKERLDKIAKLEKELKAVKDAVCYHDKMYEEAHHERTQLQEQEDTRVSDLLDERIREETEKERLKTEELAKAVAKTTQENQSQEVIDSIAKLAKLEKERDTAMAELRRLQAPAAPVAPVAPVVALVAPSMKKARRWHPSDNAPDADPADLPNQPTPLANGAESDQLLKWCANVHLLLEDWIMNGQPDVTFCDLRAYSTTGNNFDKLTHELLGAKLWKGWFGVWSEDAESSEARGHEFIPRQALMYVKLALDKLGAQYVQDEESRKAAKTSYRAMSEASKRRRED
jgi:hypothetical protein